MHRMKLLAAIMLTVWTSGAVIAGPMPISPGYAAAMPSGPDSRVKMTEAYARLVARDAYVWGWPLVNMANRRAAYTKVTERVYAGAAPMAPLNQLTMLTDYFPSDVKVVACPNQDVVYGGGLIALDESPVILQVPDFGDRFWVYQVVDARTDSFAQLGKMYGTLPGFYMLVGPNWKGEIPRGVRKVFRATSNTGNVVPRIFVDDTKQDKTAVQEVLKGVMMYPVDQFDGRMKSTDWASLKHIPAVGGNSESETQWVFPDKFFDTLEHALLDAPPMPGEEAKYAQVLAVIQAAKDDPALRKAIDEEAAKAEKEVVTPLFQFRNYGIQLPHHWSTTENTAAFGTDYFTRTAVAKSNIFVNAPNETKYFYQDLDEHGTRLNGAKRYTVTFPKGATPPSYGFWSLTLYNEHHFFVQNPIDRYSVGTKTKTLMYNEDGSLTLYVQPESPGGDKESNWLPSPSGQDFSLYIRSYWPKSDTLQGGWTPPAVKVAG